MIFHLSCETSQPLPQGYGTAFYTAINVSQMMYPNDFSDPMWFGVEMYCTFGQISMKFGSHVHVPLRMKFNNFGDYLTFHLEPSSGSIHWFMTHDLQNKTFPLASAAQCYVRILLNR